jgi:hypothetical protein
VTSQVAVVIFVVVAPLAPHDFTLTMVHAVAVVFVAEALLAVAAVVAEATVAETDAAVVDFAADAAVTWAGVPPGAAVDAVRGVAIGTRKSNDLLPTSAGVLSTRRFHWSTAHPFLFQFRSSLT